MRKGEEAPKDSDGAFPAVFALLLLAAVLVAYSNTFSVPFIFDDRDSVLGNASILKLWPPEWKLHKLISGTTMDGRPLSNWTIALNYALGGFETRGYHLLNLALHSINALLLFALMGRTLRLPVFGGRFEDRGDKLAAAAAALWALHPLVTEAVTYISQRVEALAALFILLALYSFSRSATSGRPARWRAVAVGACFFGVLSKETAVVAPALALLYDRCFLSGSFRGALTRRWRLYAALALSWLPLAALMYSSGHRGNSIGYAMSEPWWKYPLTQFYSIARYLKLSVWPHPLVLDYGTTPVTGWAVILPSALLVVALAAAALFALKRAPKAGFSGAAFFLLLAPTSSVVPVLQPMVEHRMYLPLAALAALAVLGLDALAQRAGRGREGTAVLAVAALLSLVLGVATYQRNSDYATELTIWEDTARKVPENHTAYLGWGMGFSALGKNEEAYAIFRKAYELAPDSHLAIGALGLTLGRLGRAEEARKYLEVAVRAVPDKPAYRMNLGNVLLLQGKNREALAQYAEALKLYPDSPSILGPYGAALLLTGDVAGALTHLDRAIELDAKNPVHRRNAGNARLVAGDFAGAARELEKALELGMRTPEAYSMLGDARRSLGDRERARAAYVTALNLDPRNQKALNGLAAMR